jgi:hypothetical protein
MSSKKKSEKKQEAAPKAEQQTAEQKARALRATAKALRTAADHLDTDAQRKPLVSRAVAMEAEADVLAPKSNGKAKDPKPVCSAAKKDGTPCTARCTGDKQTCVDHQPAWDRLTAEERNDFGAYVEGLTAEVLANFLGWHGAKEVVKSQGF